MYVVPPDPVRVEVAPLQIVAGEALAVMVADEFTVTVTEAVLVQPKAELPVTVYVVVTIGLTVADPLLHVYVDAPDPLRVDD